MWQAIIYAKPLRVLENPLNLRFACVRPKGRVACMPILRSGQTTKPIRVIDKRVRSHTRRARFDLSRDAKNNVAFQPCSRRTPRANKKKIAVVFDKRSLIRDIEYVRNNIIDWCLIDTKAFAIIWDMKKSHRCSARTRARTRYRNKSACYNNYQTYIYINYANCVDRSNAIFANFPTISFLMDFVKFIDESKATN